MKQCREESVLKVKSTEETNEKKLLGGLRGNWGRKEHRRSGFHERVL